MLSEKTKTKPQGTLDFKLNKQMDTFSFEPPVTFSQEGNWLLSVTGFEAVNSVFKITDQNNSFQNTTTGHWNVNDGEKTNNRLNNLLELTSQNDIELQVKETEKRRFGFGMLEANPRVTNGPTEGGQFGEYKNFFSDLDTQKSLMNEELKNINYKDLEDMVYRRELPNDETVDKLP